MITVEFNDFDEMVRFAERLTGPAGNGASATPGPASEHAFSAPQSAASWQAPMAPPAQAPVQQPPTQPVTQGMGIPAQQPSVPPMAQQAPIPPAVPTSAPSYTPDDLARAAMTLMDSGRQQELIGLLQSFGVPSLPELRPDQYGAFATALRGMGAQI